MKKLIFAICYLLILVHFISAETSSSSLNWASQNWVLSKACMQGGWCNLSSVIVKNISVLYENVTNLNVTGSITLNNENISTIYIRKDGTTTTTETIPFKYGITINHPDSMVTPMKIYTGDIEFTTSYIFNATSSNTQLAFLLNSNQLLIRDDYFGADLATFDINSFVFRKQLFLTNGTNLQGRNIDWVGNLTIGNSPKAKIFDGGNATFQNVSVNFFNAVNIADTYNQTEDIARFVNRSRWASIDNYPSSCLGGNLSQGIGDTLNCTSEKDPRAYNGTLAYHANLTYNPQNITYFYKINNTNMTFNNDTIVAYNLTFDNTNVLQVEHSCTGFCWGINGNMWLIDIKNNSKDPVVKSGGCFIPASAFELMYDSKQSFYIRAVVKNPANNYFFLSMIEDPIMASGDIMINDCQLTVTTNLTRSYK